MSDLRDRIREACAAADMHMSLARLHGATKSQELSLNVYLACRAWLDAHESVHDLTERSADTVRVPRDEARPTIVCLCGSGRFRAEFEEAEFQETLAGKIVLTIGCNTKDIARDVDWQHVKPMLDELHLRKIDLADEVYIINPGGYIGESTGRELAYAKSLGKPIRFSADADALAAILAGKGEG